jgi:hypothetical protein
MIKKIFKYITRGWENETSYHHPNQRILPPFLWELLFYLVAFSIAFQVIKWLLDLF